MLKNLTSTMVELYQTLPCAEESLSFEHINWNAKLYSEGRGIIPKLIKLFPKKRTSQTLIYHAGSISNFLKFPSPTKKIESLENTNLINYTSSTDNGLTK